jgi:O-antigen/teichoic acid export membrane protein
MVAADSRGLWARAATSLFGQGLNLALGVAASIPVGRGLGPAGKGEFALYSWGVNMGVVLLASGWHGAVATVASEDGELGLAAVRIGRRRLLRVVAALLCAALACLWAGSWGWSLAAATAACQVWGQPASGALVGAGRLSAYYRGVLVQSVLLLVGVSLLWRGNGLTPERAMAVLAFAVACAMLVHNRAAGAGFGPGRSADPATPRLERLARHVWLSDLASFLTYRLDVLIVRYFTGAQGLGLYSTATAVAELGRMAPNAIGQAALRELGATEEQGRGRVARRTAAIGLAASVLFLGLLAGISPWLIPRMYGPAFAPAAPLVAWLAPGVALLGVASVAASWLSVSGRAGVTARLAWRGCVAAAVVSFVFIALIGLPGAAMASSLGYAWLAATVWRAASRDAAATKP